MFKKYYKAANDDIQPNRELIDKIFEKAQTGKPAKKVFKFRPGYGTAIAAVLVLIMGIAVFPQLNPVTEPQVIENIQPKQIEKAEIKAVEPVVEKTAESATAKKENQEATPETADLNNSVADEADTEHSPLLARMTPPTDEACEFAIADITEVTEEENETIQTNLRQKFGEVDEATGNAFIFEITGKSEFGGETIYIGRWRWWVNDHSSLLGEFVLNEQMTEMYECSPYGEDGMVKWTKTNNLLD